MSGFFSLYGLPPSTPGKHDMKKISSQLNWRLRDGETLRHLEKSKEIWLRQDKKHQAVLEKKYHNLALSNEVDFDLKTNLEPLSICGRGTKIGSSDDLALLFRQYSDQDVQYGKSQDNMKPCPGENSKDMLLLKGDRNSTLYGRTFNNLLTIMNAFYYARENDVQLGIMSNSWVFNILLKMWWAVSPTHEQDEWEANFEKAFCVKIFNNKKVKLLEGYNLLPFPENTEQFSGDFFFNNQKIKKPFDEYFQGNTYIAFQSRFLQTLFRNYNNGDGTLITGEQVQDMCSGIDAVFGRRKRNTAIYSVIHSRSLENAGVLLLGKMAEKAKCHPTAALYMEPDYVKSILRNLGMLQYPVVLITDGQNTTSVDMLLADPEIDIRLVPQNATWVGGDITLAIMSNVFIGNPASTVSQFIAKSRLAFGFGHSYLFRATKADGEWYTVCGDTCVYEHPPCLKHNRVGYCNNPL